MANDKPPHGDPERTESFQDLSAPDREGIGPYRLLQKLGEGGMGEVWQAEQSQPIRRTVAVKIIKQGMDTRQVVARFEAERQALALMDHPSVAKVFDAGATPRGRPFFVMEHVQGVPITEYCDRHRLPNRERLALFLQICQGVQHAHQKGVIHRDLKPSNVLVAIQDGRPVAKIIDFGVAKATAQKLTERTLYTELGVLIGTPEYMSPEQAELTGQDVDTRTDVYSLGVMLYELLVGALPLDSRELRSAGYEGIRRKIREEDPPKPSQRLSTLGDEPSRASAEKRQVDLPTLRSQLRGELDWIVMRALEKDRTRRYGSPAELAAEVERYLRNEPVLAGPPSATYRARKFVRRHRLGVSIAAAGVIVLVGFAVTMTVQAARIAAERDRANFERETAEEVSSFLANMLGAVDPHMLGRALWDDLRERVTEVQRSRGAPEAKIEAVLSSLQQALDGVNATDAALTLVDKQILTRASKTVENRFGDRPHIAARLEYTIGLTYRTLGLLDQAERHTKRGLALREVLFGPDARVTSISRIELAEIHYLRGRYAEAETVFRQVLAARQRTVGEDAGGTLYTMTRLAMICARQGRYDEANALRLEALELGRRAWGREHPITLRHQSRLASGYIDQGRFAEAEALARETLETQRRVQGDGHADTILSVEILVRSLAHQGRYAEADTLLRDGLSVARENLGEAHRRTIRLMDSHARLYAMQGRYAEAEISFEELLEVLRDKRGERHPYLLRPMEELASMFHEQGRREDAARVQREVLELARGALGEDHPDTIRLSESLTLILADHEASRAGDLAAPD